MTAQPEAPATPTAHPRTYEVRTYGCQMNVHDSERLTGLLEDAGYVAAPDGDQADVVVAMPNGADPHEYNPSAKTVAEINNAWTRIKKERGL